MNIDEVATRKLAMRSMAVEEMRNHLLKKGFTNTEVEEEISILLDAGYLNDNRYCAEYFRYAFSKNWSRKRAFAELRKKGVADDVMSIAFDDYQDDDDNDFDEKSMARREAEKVLRMADLTWDDQIPEKVKGRIARKLSSYGYSPTIIYGILGEMKK